MLMKVLAVLLGYLLGSIPSAYIAGRLIRGIDIRRYGSGSVSGSNVWVHVSKPALFAVGIADCAKGFVPVLLAQWLGLGLPTAALAGVAAVVGHDWSIYLKFTGGRGIGTSMGALAALDLRLAVVPLAALALGRLLGNVPLVSGMGMISLPLWALAFGEPPAVTAACLALALLTVAKRLLGNPGQPLPTERSVFVNRLLFDRDIRDREAWIGRTPSDEAGA